ncbi:MAG TPA: Gfo/Idh/MocA family oxidoreductase [Sphingomonas sp.]|nr:Gfo/Idh/MocA family oxidoreductase [Sphingomonas sp.]
MVGGGEGAFIGAIHRMAVRLTDEFDLVAGAFSSDGERGARSAASIGVAPDRSYADYSLMAAAESARPDGARAVAIVAPNDVHYDAARAFLDHGFHILCEKPLALNCAQAADLVDRVRRSNRVFGVAHTYVGYAMVRRARETVSAGSIGAVRMVQVEYPQSWLSTDVEHDGNKQAAWRTDPARNGSGGALGDIGTHAFHLAEFVSGLRCEELAADLSSFVPGRTLDDDARMLLRFKGGAAGMLWASQVAVGCANALRLRVFGETGSIEWGHEHPNELVLSTRGQPTQMLVRGADGVGSGFTTLPAGHPEGYIEAFAQLYSDFVALIRQHDNVEDRAPGESLLPTVEDGLRGIEFIAAAIRSHTGGGAWTKIN